MIRLYNHIIHYNLGRLSNNPLQFIAKMSISETIKAINSKTEQKSINTI